MKQSINQKGNVLFLILIAVALFAALSYAVTQSSRSGGDAGRETNMINAAQLTQFPASVRTSVMRLVIDGVPVENMHFNTPSDIVNAGVSVFSPSGGGSVYQQATSSIMADQRPGKWYFNLEFEVLDLGNSGNDGVTDNELIAFLPNITRPICERVNQEAEIPNLPVTSSDLSATYEENMDDSYTEPTGAGVDLIAAMAGSDAEDDMRGKAFGCFRNTSTGDYVFYNVLFEQ